MNDKCVCQKWKCGWRGFRSEILVAEDPFNHGGEITACPACRELGRLVTACDEPDCWLPATFVWSTGDGYRYTCGDHWRDAKIWAASHGGERRTLG